VNIYIKFTLVVDLFKRIGLNKFLILKIYQISFLFYVHIFIIFILNV